MKKLHRTRRQEGFTLIETMVAMGVLSFGILALVGVFTQGLKTNSTNQIQFIAQAKAQEAIEDIFTARNTQTLAWSQINNVSLGGVFLDGPQPLLAAGPDGLVGTADDLANQPDTIVVGPPGTNDIQSTAGDQVINLNTMMTRTIAFSAVASNPNLQKITVTITYTVQGQTNQFVLTTYISCYS
ncbi:MAG: prepilin-type N-terminal cleavage/methylation domain-containing protein [Candidatus Acidiferrum sp.]